MSTIQFPTGVPNGTTFTADNGVTYTYDSSGGGGWTAYNSEGFDDRYVEVAGDTMTGDLDIGDIHLDTDGSASFANANQLFVQGTTGAIFLKDTGNATPQDWKIKLDSSGAAFFGSGNVAITTGGSATLAGDIQSTSQNGGQLAGFRNVLINGGFETWQRGDGSFIDQFAYTTDRWYLALGGASVQRFRDLGVPTGNCIQIDSAATIGQLVELPVANNGDCAPGPFMPGTTWTFSFYSTNSSVSAQTNMSFREGSTDDSPTLISAVTSFTKTGETITGANGTYTRYSATMTVNSTAVGSNKGMLVTIPAEAGDKITMAQLEPGPVATPFEHRPIATELAVCQRYYSRVEVGGGSYPGVYWDGSETYYGQFISFPVTMRALPNSVDFVSVIGNFMWVNPGQYGTSDPSTAGITFSFSPYSFALRQDRIGSGSAAPQPGYSYILEGAFTVEADAEL